MPSLSDFPKNLEKKDNHIESKPLFCQVQEQKLTYKIQGISAHVKALIEMQELANESINKQNIEIIKQVKETNGRVTKLEKETIVWRWLTEKPVRIFIAIVIFKVIIDVGVWDMLLQLFK